MTVKARRLSLLALILFAGCGKGRQVSVMPVDGQGTPRPADQESASLWEAVEDLDLDYQLTGTEPEEGRELLEGLRLTYHGQSAAAEELFAGLCRKYVEAEVGAAACPAWGSLLLGGFAWEEIERLTRENPVLARAAGLEGLGLVFADPLLTTMPETLRWESRPAVVETRRSRWGPPMIRVEVEGHPFWFWLDTGSTLSVLTTDTARQTGVEALGSRSGLGPTTTNRQIAMRPGVVGELRLGSLVINNHPVAIVADEALDFPAGSGIDGIIGWPVFRRLSVEIDLAAGTTTLRRPAAGGRVEPNLFWLGYPLVVAAGGGGEPLILGLDTGAARTSLLTHAGRKIGPHQRERDRKRRWGVGGGELEEVLTLSDFSLEVDRSRFRFAAISMRQEGVRAAVLVRPDGKLGSDLLTQTRMVVDFSNGLLACQPR